MIKEKWPFATINIEFTIIKTEENGQETKISNEEIEEFMKEFPDIKESWMFTKEKFYNDLYNILKKSEKLEKFI